MRRRGTGARSEPGGPRPRYGDAALAALGLEVGDRARFRRHVGERWIEGVVQGVERDGSLGLRDAKGAWRAIPVALVEVQAIGPRGGRTWEALSARATRSEQLPLL